MIRKITFFIGTASLAVSIPAYAGDCNLNPGPQAPLAAGFAQTAPRVTAEFAGELYRTPAYSAEFKKVCSQKQYVKAFMRFNPKEVLQTDTMVTAPVLGVYKPTPAPSPTESASTPAPTPTPTATAPVMVVNPPAPAAQPQQTVVTSPAVAVDQAALRENQRKLGEVNAELVRARRQLSKRPVSTWTKEQTERVAVLETAKLKLENAIVDITKRLDNVEGRLGLIEHTVIKKDGSSNVYTKAEADKEFLDEEEVKALIAAENSAKSTSWFGALPWWWWTGLVLGIILLVFAWKRRRSSQSSATAPASAAILASHVHVPARVESELNSLPVNGTLDVEARVGNTPETVTFTKVNQDEVTCDRMTGGNSPMPIAGIRNRLKEDLARQFPA